VLSNLNYSINAIVPVFILVLFGAFLKRIGFVNDDFLEISEKFVFKISLPVMLFLEVAGSSLENIANGRLILFCVLSVTVAFICVTVFARLCLPDPNKRGAFVQGMCRSNFAILGVPLADNMFGEMGTSTIAIVMPFVILMFNSYSVMILSLFSADVAERMNRKKLIGIAKNIVTNPLIIGVILALPFMFFSIELPVIMSKSLQYLSDLTTPLTLIFLGANFKVESLTGRVGYAIGSAVGKTVILPLIMVTIAVVFGGFRGAQLGVILILFGAPSAASSYIMAKRMKNDGELAAQILLLSTLFCVFTIFVGIFILKSLQLI